MYAVSAPSCFSHTSCASAFSTVCGSALLAEDHKKPTLLGVIKSLCTQKQPELADTQPLMSPCTAETRSAKMFSKKSYETGVVIVTCPGCKGNHLIADRLGWFGEPGSIEDYLSAQGQGITLTLEPQVLPL